MALRIVLLVNRGGKRVVRWSGVFAVAAMVLAIWALIAIGYFMMAVRRMPTLNDWVFLAILYSIALGGMFGRSFWAPVDRLTKGD
jgi:hypothetical protein